MSKAKKYLKDNKEEQEKMKDWINFLINPKNLEGESKMKNVSKELQKAYELWQNMSLTEEEREVAERRYLNLAAIEGAKEYEYKQGRAEGLELGRAEGKLENKKEIAKEMLKENMNIEIIAKITKLTKEEIKNLKNKTS